MIKQKKMDKEESKVDNIIPNDNILFILVHCIIKFLQEYKI